MKAQLLLAGAALVLALPAGAQTPLPPPVFHHLMLNTTDPDKAIAYYSKGFINTKPAKVGRISRYRHRQSCPRAVQQGGDPAGGRYPDHALLAFRLERHR